MKILKVVTLAVLLGLARNTFALDLAVTGANCGSQYNQNDRAEVFSVLNSVMNTLSRMQQIALVSSEGVFSVSQREALENEYQMLMNLIKELGELPRPGLNPESARFLNTVLTTRYLRIEGTMVNGHTIDEAQQNAHIAVLATSRSDFRLWHCFYN